MPSKKYFQIMGMLSFSIFLSACSNLPPFTLAADTEKLRADIRTMRKQWESERCPNNARKSQCAELMQSGLQHCLKRNPSEKTKCIYKELHCTLFEGEACRY